MRYERGMAAAGRVAEALHLLLAGRKLLAARSRLPLLALQNRQSIAYGLCCS